MTTIVDRTAVALVVLAATSAAPARAEARTIESAAARVERALPGVARLAGERSDWLAYARIDELRVAAATPDRQSLALLDDVARRLRRDAVGMARPPLVQLRGAIDDLAVALRAADPGVEERTEEAVALLERLETDGLRDPRRCAVAAAAARWLRSHGQPMPALAGATNETSRPNLLLWFDPGASPEANGARRCNTEPISGVLNGSSYRGTATRCESASVVVGPLGLALRIDGDVTTHTRSTASGVTVTGGATYRYRATAPIEWVNQRWQSGRATVSGEYATASPRVSGARGLFAGRVRSEVTARYRRNQADAEAELAGGVRSGVTAAAAAAAEALNRPLRAIGNRLQRTGTGDPRPTRYGSGSNSVTMAWTLDAARLLNSASPPPPRPTAGSGVQLHESALNAWLEHHFPRGEMTLRALAGRLGLSGRSNEVDSNGTTDDATVILPIRGAAAAFLRSDGVRLMVHVDELIAEGERYGPADLDIAYAFNGDAALTLGEVTIRPRSAFPRVTRGGIRNVAARRVLADLIRDALPASVNLRDIGATALGDGRQPREVDLADGWLTARVD